MSQKAAIPADNNDLFRSSLQQILKERMDVNPRYSLRAFGRSVGIHHGTLSQILNGNRKLTLRMQKLLSEKLEHPSLVASFANQLSPTGSQDQFQRRLSSEQFESISEWKFDAILESLKIQALRKSPAKIAHTLRISLLETNLALRTLERLGLVENRRGTWLPTEKNTSLEMLGSIEISTGRKLLQRKWLELSIGALEAIPFERRSHSSVTMAIDSADLPIAKNLIKKFRRDLNALLQRKKTQPNEVYQLCISFFPISEGKDNK